MLYPSKQPESDLHSFAYIGHNEMWFENWPLELDIIHHVS